MGKEIQPIKPDLGICSHCGKKIRWWGSYVKTEEFLMHGQCYTLSLGKSKGKK